MAQREQDVDLGGFIRRESMLPIKNSISKIARNDQIRNELESFSTTIIEKNDGSANILDWDEMDLETNKVNYHQFLYNKGLTEKNIKNRRVQAYILKFSRPLYIF